MTAPPPICGRCRSADCATSQVLGCRCRCHGKPAPPPPDLADLARRLAATPVDENDEPAAILDALPPEGGRMSGAEFERLVAPAANRKRHDRPSPELVAEARRARQSEERKELEIAILLKQLAEARRGQ